jgi:pimeloyl-ACP methyl ester carboxylesterase
MIASKLASLLDSLLTRLSAWRAGAPPGSALSTHRVATPVGCVQVFDSGAVSDARGSDGTTKPCVILVPDGPNVIAHYEALIGLLSARLRVVVFDMPGFGQSLPDAAYGHSLGDGARAVLGVMDALQIERATLAFSCANGFYALAAARLAPQRVTQLILSQTPSLEAMQGWVNRIIPWPLKMPVIGQLAGWALRRKAALGWYRLALPRGADAAPFQGKARMALAGGGCFCLAGVVQGLGRELPALQAGALGDMKVPCTLVWGTQDRSHRPEAAHSLAAYLPHATQLEFEDCGHFPDVEQAARFAQLVLRLVK